MSEAPTPDPSRHSIRALVEVLRERKASLLLGDRLIENLRCFLSGWFWANGDRASDQRVWDNFEAHIRTRFRVDECHAWYSVLRYYSATGADAYEAFLREFDESLRGLDGGPDHPATAG